MVNVKGGIKAWKGHSVSGSAKMGMALLKGDEHPAEIVLWAYRMEEAARQFYASTAAATDDPEVSALLGQLADMEAKHKDRLFELYQSIEDSPLDRENVEGGGVATALEGGVTADDLESRKRSAPPSTEDVLSMAMMLEAQAVDLYLRCADRRVDQEAKKILCLLADEEKAHLHSLGCLLEQKM